MAGVATKNSISHSTYEDSQFLFTRYRFRCWLYLVPLNNHCAHTRESITQSKRSAVLRLGRLVVVAAAQQADDAAQESRLHTCS